MGAENKDEAKKEGEEGGNSASVKGLSTEDAIKALSKLNDIKLSNIKKFLKLVASAK